MILKGDEAKAKRVLAFVARVNCMQMLAGRLVTQEEKEEVIRQRTQLPQGKASNAFVESAFCEHRQQRRNSSLSSYGSTVLGEETPPLEDEMFTNSNGHAIDVSEVQRLLLASSQHCTDDEECSWLCVRKTIRDKVTNYYHWFLLLFKNGWWRTTLLLWYLW